MAFIRKVKTSSGATAVQIAHKYRGRINRIEHIGSAHTPEDIQSLVVLAKKRLLGEQMSLLPENNHQLRIIQKQSVSRLLGDCLRAVYQKVGFDQLSDDIFVLMCIARIAEPTSKLDSIRVLSELGIKGVSNTAIHRCLKRVVTKDYRDQLARLCFARASTNGDLTLVLYDVTTLYFEVQQEDDYRRPGLSKERRLEPQIVVGLLVDRNGFPLELHSFEGNKAETKTILPVMEAFRKRHGVTNLSVVADAGMLSQANLALLAQAGYGYIVGSRLNKVPYDIEQYQKQTKLSDGQIFTAKTKTAHQRVVYQYREKRASLDRRNIAKQIAKAENIVEGKTQLRHSKFVKLGSRGATRSLNTKLIDKALSLVGIKGYVTNLSIPAAEVIASYHELWHVEQSFRMSKSDLKARPIFHHRQEAIEAHLTIVMAALAIGRTIEQLTGLSIKKFVKLLKPIHSGEVAINGVSYPTEPELPETVQHILRQLGH
jgi:hypothetical protein